MTKRPLSPHLQIYRPQITSVLSICHRLSGVALSVGVIIAVAWLYCLASSQSNSDLFKTYWHQFYGGYFLYPLVFAFHYHCFNGVRHLIWDAGHGFELHSVTRSGIIVLLLTLISTALFAKFFLI